MSIITGRQRKARLESEGHEADKAIDIPVEVDLVRTSELQDDSGEKISFDELGRRRAMLVDAVGYDTSAATPMLVESVSSAFFEQFLESVRRSVNQLVSNDSSLSWEDDWVAMEPDQSSAT